MRICTARIIGTTGYSQSKAVDDEEIPKLPKESVGDYDKRNWRHKATVDADGIVCIPAMALKFAVDEAVKRLALQIPGRGKTTYSKFFVAGAICIDDPGPPLGIHIDAVAPIKIWANSDGVRGSGKRVRRIFPYIPAGWEALATFAVLDDVIPTEVFEKGLIEAGRLIGIGRFRPQVGGLLGRFDVASCTWTRK